MKIAISKTILKIAFLKSYQQFPRTDASMINNEVYIKDKLICDYISLWQESMKLNCEWLDNRKILETSCTKQWVLTLGRFTKSLDKIHMQVNTMNWSLLPFAKKTQSHDDVIKLNHFRVTGPLWGESTGHRWIPRTIASDADLWCFLWSAPEQTVKQTIKTLVILDAI